VRRLLSCVWVLAAGAAMAAPVAAQLPTFSQSLTQDEQTIRPPTTAGNAAWVYIKAWDTLPTDQQARTKLGETLVDRPKAGGKLSKGQREQLATLGTFIDGVVSASTMEQCDWGPRFEDGLMCLLPHLGQLRTSARALALDARRLAEDGNGTLAAERVAAMFRLSEHASADTVIISTLVGVAIGNFASTVTDELHTQGDLTPAGARTIRAALRRVVTKDLYRTGEALETERRLVIDWLRRECKGPDAGKVLVRHLSLLGSMREVGIDPREQVFFMDEAKLAGEFDRAERFYDLVKLAWGRPNALAALQELELEAAEGQHGMVTAAVAASFSRVRYSTEHARRTFARLDRVLSEIIEHNDAEAGK
jgi:hypothetical protein